MQTGNFSELEWHTIAFLSARSTLFHEISKD